MRFKVSWIRDIKDAAQNVSFLIDTADEPSIRDFCGNNGIVIFELTPYKEPTEAFGKVSLQVAFEHMNYEIITTYDKISDAYMFFAPLHRNIVSINHSEQHLNDEEVAAVLQQLSAEFDEMQRKIGPKEQPKDIGNVVLEQDPELEKMKRVCNQAISDIEEMHEKASSSFALRRLSELKSIEDELRKVRMGSNIPKMRSLISDGYRIMEQIEMEYLDQQQVTETTLMADSTITHLDLVREYEKYEKAQKIKTGKLEKTPSDMYYIFFGKIGIYQRFLGKDIGKKLDNRGDIMYASIDYMVMFILMCIVWLTITSVYKYYVLREQIFYFIFVDFALIGLILVVINALKRRSVTQISILLIVWIVLYFVIRYILISNFAL